MKTGKLLLTGTIAITLGLVSCTRMDNIPTPQNDYALNGIDAEFITKANHDHHREIKIGSYAATNGTSQDVRDYGAKMVDEHQKALVKLQELATAATRCLITRQAVPCIIKWILHARLTCNDSSKNIRGTCL